MILYSQCLDCYSGCDIPSTLRFHLNQLLANVERLQALQLHVASYGEIFSSLDFLEKHSSGCFFPSEARHFVRAFQDLAAVLSPNFCQDLLGSCFK